MSPSRRWCCGCGRRRRRWWRRQIDIFLDRWWRSPIVRKSVRSLSSRSLDTALSFEHKLCPGFGLVCSRRAFSDCVREDIQPGVFVGRAISVEVNHLPVTEPDAEPLFNKHVSFFLFGKCRLAPLSTTCCSFFLRQGASVVDKLGRLGKVDRSTGLACSLMVGS